MDYAIVIARAHGGNPLKRLVVKVGNGRVYVANPDRIQAVELGESSPVGFPKEDIFLFNSEAYEALCTQWRSAGQTDPLTWCSLRPFYTDHIAQLSR